MGISGLHHQLKPAQKRIDVSELRGRTLALDGHALLHRGALSCAEQLAEGEPTTRYAHFAVQRVQMLTNKGITSIVVFDGAPTPLKKDTNRERRANREQALADARQWKLECERRHAAGEDREDAIDAMRKAYRGTVRVTPTMVEVTKRELEKVSVRCLVAPYEADAQLAALCVLGLADGIITEDSDLACLLCGLRLSRCLLVTKLDRDGTGDLLIPGDLTKLITDLRRSKFAKAMAKALRVNERTGARCFVQACVLAGCDYHVSEAGLGLVGAAEHVCAARRLNDDERIEKAVKRLSNVEGAKAAERAFYHAKVWKGLPGPGVVPRCVSLSELVCPSRVSVPPLGSDIDAEVGPSLNFEACERERAAAAFPPAQHTIDAAFARAAPAAPPPKPETPVDAAAPLPEPEPPAPPPVDAGIDGAEVDLETLNELPPDVRAEVERQLMLWRATRRGAARSPPPPAPDAPKPRARSSGARPRSSSSGDAKKPAAKKKTTRRKTAPEALRPANAADVQSFFAPKPGAAKRPRWRST
jgi:exonuclease-1